MKDSNIKKYVPIGIASFIGVIIGAAIVIVFLLILVRTTNRSSNNVVATSNNSTNKSNSAIISSYQGSEELIESSKEHVIQEFGIKFVAPDDMVLLSDKGIEQYRGTGYSQFYEVMAMSSNEDKLFYCFVISDEKYKDYTEEQYLNESLQNSNHGEIQKEKIADTEFSKVTMTYEEDGKKYNEACYISKQNGKFLCFDYWYVDGIENNITSMIQKIQ